MKTPNLNKCFIILAILLVGDCILGGYIGWWRETFWNAVENRNAHVFWVYLSYFSVVALLSCYITGYSKYLSSYMALIMRRDLTKKALLSNHKEYEGGSQRVQEDCLTYPTLLVTLIAGMVRNILTLFIFSFILIKQLNWMYLMIPIIYAVISTYLASILAKPLIAINYLNQNLEAKFRQVLSKLNYAKVHRNNYVLFKATKKLAYFQTFFNQITVIIPYIILFPIYFGAKVTFGIFMQAASSMAEVINCLSYVINSFNDYNKWLSCRKRLKELGVI